MRIRPEHAGVTSVETGMPATAPWTSPPVVVVMRDAGAFFAQVTLASVLLNAPSRSFPLVVAARSPDGAAVAGFDRLGKRLGAGITVVDLAAASPATGDGPPPDLRLVLPEVLDCARMALLESDLVVQADITAIWNGYQDGKVAGGVPDRAGRDWKRANGRTVPDLYVNSGVLLLDCEAWRRERAGTACRDWLEQNRASVQFPFQDSLNAALEGRIYPIEETWNVTPNELRRKGVTNIEQFYDVDTFSGIFHFDGPSPKPWCRWSNPWTQELYLRYARVVGLPADFWVEARTLPEAAAEARWAERKGDLVKANRIYRRIVDGLMQRGAAAGASRRLQ